MGKNNTVQVIDLAGSTGQQQIARTYNITVNLYSESKNVLVEANCFAYMFTNIGDTPATVNGMVIFPSATPANSIGDSRSISGHQLDIYKGNITLAFPPGGTNPLVEIVQEFYNESYK
jgi:hypothetical protein